MHRCERWRCPQGLDGCNFWPSLRKMLVLLMVLGSLQMGMARQARANPTVPQGGSATFASAGTDAPQPGVQWDIYHSGTFIANNYVPNSWSVSYSAGNFTVSAPSSATITTSYEVRYTGGVSAYFDVVAAALALSSVSINPTSVLGTVSAQGTVTLNAPAPGGGVTVMLTSSNTSAATVPASIMFPGGTSTTTFPISTFAVTTSTSVTITASYNGVNKTATLTVLPQPTLTGVSVNPTSTTGGTSVTGTVTLSSVAPSVGIAVTLSSNTPSAATVPANVVVLSGQTTQTFTVTTLAVATATTVTLSASYNGGTQTTTLVVQPPTLSAFSISPNSVTGGQITTGTVTLNGPAPANCNVNITCSDSRAILTGTVTVAQGARSLSFPITTSTVNVQVSVTVTAAYNGSSFMATLTLSPTYLRVNNVGMSGSTSTSTPPVSTVALSLVWNSTTTNSFLLSRYNVSNGVVQGFPGMPTWTVSLPANSSGYTDTSGLTSGQTYYYRLTDASGTPVFLSDEMVIPYQLNDVDNQTVDSRVDPRYATLHYLDFQFGTSDYKGGLFAGYAADNAKIGRSLLKFLPTRPTLGDFRMGTVNAFNTGTVTSGNNAVSVPVGCQTISNASWSGSSVVWSQMFSSTGNPGSSFSGSSASAHVTVNYNPTAPVFQWYSWNLSSDINNAANTSQPLSVVLAGTNESSSGWAYFAKDNYQAGTAPCVTYVYDYVIPITITLSPTTVNAYDGSSTCTVTLNGLGLGDSATVAMSVQANGTGNNLASSFTNFPTSFSATGYLSSRQFTFSVPQGLFGGAHGSMIPYTITASCNGVSASAVLTVVTP